MKFSVFFVVQAVGLSIALAQIVFEDYFSFSELNNTKWKAYNKKADCEWKYLSKKFEKKSSCITSNKANLRTLSGNLGITAVKEKYFNAKATTALIESRNNFHIEVKKSHLLIKFRAAIPLGDSLIPFVFLRDNKQDINLFEIGLNLAIPEDDSIDFDENESLINNTDLTQFHNYTFIIDEEIIAWKLNDNYIHREKLGTVNDLEDSKFSKGDFKLIITINVANDQEIEKGFGHHSNNSCNSFLVDYIQVIEFDKLENYKDKFVSENSMNANVICDSINELAKTSIIEFIPEYPRIVFEDHFSKNKIDEKKWLIFINNKPCHWPKIKDCNTTQNTSSYINDGKLKIMANNLKPEETVWTQLVSKMCFKNGRIEIKAKLPSEGFFITMETFPGQCLEGFGQGRLVIAEGPVMGIIRSRIRYEGRYYIDHDYKVPNETYSYYSIIGIEWTKTSIQWFINETVVFQANRQRSQNDKAVAQDNNEIKLPFDYPFNLIISFKNDFETRSNYLEIDYVKVFGERQIFAETSANNLILIIISSSLVMIILIIILIIIIIILWRRNNKRQSIDPRNLPTQENQSEIYDDVNEDEKYYTIIFPEYDLPDFEKIDEKEEETEHYEFMKRKKLTKNDYEEINDQ